TVLSHSGSAFPFIELEPGPEFQPHGSMFNISGGPGIKDYGYGGRLAFNGIRGVSLEAEMNFFPRDLPTSSSRVQALFGVKAGKRFGRVGIFGKLRPGFVSYSENKPASPIFATPRKTLFALDLGGVVEINH